MKIENLKINNYGKIENRDIKLKKGINIIKGDNEAGKSTILSFINSMLHGIDKTKKGGISEYDKFLPWVSSNYSGSMEYTLDNGTKYYIYRDFKKKNPVVLDENKNDISKEYILGRKNIDIIEAQIGIDKNTFQNTCISYQKLVVLDDSSKKEMVQKMTNLVSTGEENVSYSNIMKSLNNRQLVEIGTQRTKKRPINELEEKIERLEKEKQSIYGIKNKREESEQKREIAQKEFSRIGYLKEIINELKEYYLTQETLRTVHKEKKKKISVKKDEIYEKKSLRKDTITKTNIFASMKKQSIIQTTIAILFALIIYVFLDNTFNIGIITEIHNSVKNALKSNYTYLLNDSVFKIIIASSIVIINCLILLIIYLFKNGKEKRRIAKLSEENRSIEKEINILRKDIIQEEKELEKELRTLDEKTEQFKEMILSKYRGIIEREELDQLLLKEFDEIVVELKKIEKRYEESMYRLSQLNAERNVVETSAYRLTDIIEELTSLQEEKQKLLTYNEAFEAAKEILTQSYEELKNNVGPEFAKRLSYIAGKITNGKYTNISINDNYEIKVKAEHGEYVNLEVLSTGTIEQINVALRIALLETMSKEMLPIILDEAFAFYDDERLENFIRFLYEEYTDRQIIIFTCSEREKQIITKLDLDVNYIVI
ncbi:MAG: ATP-binding protein [Clostridium sp.]